MVPSWMITDWNVFFILIVSVAFPTIIGAFYLAKDD